MSKIHSVLKKRSEHLIDTEKSAIFLSHQMKQRQGVTQSIWNGRKAGPYPKKIAIMGSTGSIGVNTLKIVREHPEKFRVTALAVNKSIHKLVKQVDEFKPEYVCVFDKQQALKAEKLLKPKKVKVVAGIEGLEFISTLKNVDEIIFAVVGAVGLIPIFAAIRAGKIVAIANKEPLVMAGELLMAEARSKGVPVLPIDSEHSGLWQCLEGSRGNEVSKLVLTSSGGPFRKKKGSLANVTIAQALNHPRWKMGPKITVDSATLMNKGLEVIEAANLFGISSEKVEVLIHPEAIIHGMIEFDDGSYLAQMGITDMRIPIQYALSYPERFHCRLPKLDFVKIGKFHFEKPDMHRFPCLALGYESSRIGGSMPAVLNAANEIVVDAFLNQKIKFTDIPKKIQRVMKKHSAIRHPGLKDLLQVDEWARKQAEAIL